MLHERKIAKSSPGLTVTFEVASSKPSVYEKATLWYGVHRSPFGRCFIACSSKGIHHLSFVDTNDDIHDRLQRIHKDWPTMSLLKDKALTEVCIKKIFKSGDIKRSFHLVLKGTPFQQKVWRALIAVPKGELVQYTHIARSIGHAKAVRAVGSACGKNSIAFLIPCHRAIAKGGGLGGYRWGIERKKALLQWEESRF